MFQRLIALFILFTMLVKIGGYYPIFMVERWHIRKEIKRSIKSSIPEKDLHRISFSKSTGEINWVREGKEFSVNGQMYDIVKSEECLDTIHYYCISDDEETELFAHLDERTKKQMENDPAAARRPVKQLLKIVTSLFYLPVTEQFNGSFSSRFKGHSAYSVFYPSVYYEKATPPPKTIL